MSQAGRSIEMSPIKARDNSVAQGSNYTSLEPVYDDTPAAGFAVRFLDSFRRDPSRRVTTHDSKDEASMRAEAGRAEHDGLRYYDIHQAALQTAHSGLARKLKGRHLQMIAIGGSIGGFAHPRT
jgi:amino acid transporter